jgi:hypothetical protein
MPADESTRRATSPRVTTKTATGTRSRMDGGLLRLLGPPQPAIHLPAGPNGTRNPAARGLRDGARPQPSSLASPQGLKVRNGERSQEPKSQTGPSINDSSKPTTVHIKAAQLRATLTSPPMLKHASYTSPKIHLHAGPSKNRIHPNPRDRPSDGPVHAEKTSGLDATVSGSV